MIKKTFFISIILIAILSTISCQFFRQKNEDATLAKVHDTYLYQKDLDQFNFNKGLSEKDSVGLLTQYIDDWATKKLLMHKAEENLSNDKLEDFKKLVDDYKTELYISAYKNMYIQKNINTVVNDEEINTYYKENKNSFLTKETLVKVRYIKLPKNFKDLTATKKKFDRFNEEDQEELTLMIPAFINSNFNNEDIWLSHDDLITKLPELSGVSKSKIFTKGKVTQISEQNGKLLLDVYNIIKPGNVAPIEFVKKTIKQIILNKRKLGLQQKLEKEITKDAIQTKDYTIFH